MSWELLVAITSAVGDAVFRIMIAVCMFKYLLSNQK